METNQSKWSAGGILQQKTRNRCWCLFSATAGQSVSFEFSPFMIKLQVLMQVRQRKAWSNLTPLWLWVLSFLKMLKELPVIFMWHEFTVFPVDSLMRKYFLLLQKEPIPTEIWELHSMEGNRLWNKCVLWRILICMACNILLGFTMEDFNF